LVIGKWLASQEIASTDQEPYTKSGVNTQGWLPMVPGAWSYQLLAEPDEHRGVAGHSEFKLLFAEGGVTALAAFFYGCRKTTLERAPVASEDAGNLADGAADCSQLFDHLAVDGLLGPSHYGRTAVCPVAFSHRWTMTSQYSGDSSMRSAVRPIFSAAMRDEPEPAKRSSTVSPSSRS